jgi:hypothetical protein
MKFKREWAMPNKNTFSIKPIEEFVLKYTMGADCVVDPFARDTEYGHYTNDLNPETKADYHMKAEDFCLMLQDKEVKSDLVLFDPPYSPRQISECYKGIGLEVSMEDTQASFWKKVRDTIDPLVIDGGIVLSFGWHTNGMGKTRGYEIEEILLVAHGGAHNDTICMAERKVQGVLF